MMNPSADARGRYLIWVFAIIAVLTAIAMHNPDIIN
jgi:hypothetical protein